MKTTLKIFIMVSILLLSAAAYFLLSDARRHNEAAQELVRIDGGQTPIILERVSKVYWAPTAGNPQQ